MTVPGLGAVGSGGRGVPGSAKKGKVNQLEQGERAPGHHGQTELNWHAMGGQMNEAPTTYNLLFSTPSPTSHWES